MGRVDARMKAFDKVIGVSSGNEGKAFPVRGRTVRKVFSDTINGQDIVVFWYGLTETAVAFHSEVDGKKLTFVDSKGPEATPFKDVETGSLWTLAGRAVDGKLKGKELKWIDSIQCNWYAWSSEYPKTALYMAEK